MASKHLSDLLQEETEKVTKIEDAAAIDVKATPVDNSAVEEEVTVTDTKNTDTENTDTENTNVTQVDLEATVKELKATLKQAHQNEVTFQDQISGLQSALSQQEGLALELKKELQEAKQLADLETTVQQLKQQLEQAQQKEQTLEQQVKELQTAIAAKEQLTERLKKELYQAKQDIVKLAEINSALKAQVNGSKQIHTSKQHQPQSQPQRTQPQKSAIQPAKSDLRPQNYRKSHLVRDTRPIARSPKPSGPSSEDNSDNSSQMWLLD